MLYAQPWPGLPDALAMTWWTFSDESGVLELDAPEVELHLHVVGGKTVAWWTSDRGCWLGLARVGLA